MCDIIWHWLSRCASWFPLLTEHLYNLTDTTPSGLSQRSQPLSLQRPPPGLPPPQSSLPPQNDQIDYNSMPPLEDATDVITLEVRCSYAICSSTQQSFPTIFQGWGSCQAPQICCATIVSACWIHYNIPIVDYNWSHDILPIIYMYIQTLLVTTPMGVWVI